MHIGLALTHMLKLGASSSQVEHMETEVLHLACHYEWIPNHLLDFLYLEVLNYFYHKGALESIFASSPIRERILVGYALGRLPSILRKFVREARATGVELPDGFYLH